MSEFAGPDSDGGQQATMVRTVPVDGIPIRYAVSEGSRDACLMLVHGRVAHRMWFYRFAPELEASWRVVQPDLSGHGDSGRRSSYDAAVWAREVLAVVEAESDGPAVLVGHSMGGRVALVAASMRPDLVRGLVMLDSPIRRRGETALRPVGPERPLVYPSREEAIGRFRLSPVQPEPDVTALRPVAEYSVTEAEGGWTWKFHQIGLPVVQDDFLRQCLSRLTVPLHYVYAESSGLVRRSMLEHVRACLPSSARMVGIPGAYHHLVLDSPARTAEVVDHLARELSPR